MSFGFSIGDFIAAFELANRIRKEFVGAPKQFKDVSDEVRSLSIILRDVDVSLSERELNSQQKKDLKDIADACRNVLDELETTLDKYSELEPRQSGTSKRIKRAWKGLMWEPDDIRDFRRRITSNVTLLNSFSERFTRDDVAKLVRHQDDQERRDVAHWLTPIDYAHQQNDFINRRQRGTGQWFLDSVEYQAWLTSNTQTLFCPGIPGAGKTILTSIVVGDLHKRFQGDGTIGVAYIYCNFRRQDEQKVDSLLASLLRQLSQDRPPLADSVKTLYDRHIHKRTRPSLDELIEVLQSVAATYSRVFIIVDALDECQIADGSRQRFLVSLFNLLAKYEAKLFATSRPISSIEKQFEGSTMLEIRASEEDVRRYLEGHIIRLPGFVVRSLQLQEEIKTRIVEAVDGMFQLAQLHLDSLIGKRAPKSIRTALENLATGSGAYDHAYGDAMARINGQLKDQEELAKQVLSWITCAKRPLTILELQHALGIEVGKTQLDEDNLPEIEDMISVCAGLVTVDEESNIIRLVHYTTQEFFDRTQKRWFPDAEIDIAKACVTYLSFDIFEAGICSTDEELAVRLQDNAFYDYAAQSWGHHARIAPELMRMDTLMLPFLESEVKVAGASQVMLMLRNYSGPQRIPKGVKGLHTAVYFGLQSATIELLERGHDPEATDSDGQTPLMWAINNGHDTLVEVLLAKELSINASDTLKRTALHHAASIGQISSMALLMQRRADVEARDSQGQTPLLAAVSKGQRTAVGFLLGVGADQNAFDEKRKGALHLSIESDYISVEMVALLLAHDVPAEMVDIDNMSPLHCTIQYKRRDIASLLLQNGVTIDFGIQRRSWMQRLRDGSATYELYHANITQELHTSGLGGLTPLHFAALVGNVEMTEFFLSQGADPNALSTYRETPLHLALSKDIQGSKYEDAWNQDRSRLEFLWDFVEFFDDGECEAVATQITNTRKAVVEALLRDDRTDVTLQDAQGSSLLHTVNYRELEPVPLIRRLIQKGASVSARNSKGQTALHLASFAGHLESVDILITEGAALEMTDNEGKTAIHYAAKSRNTQTIMAILGAYEGKVRDILALKDNNGRTVLHHSVENSWPVKLNMIEMLLRLGASASNMDDFGNSPLAHYLSQSVVVSEI